ncbi:MAG: DUF4037 domain-containing protein [Lentisphaeria bacterium]|nr:DUF4037 domain-containing protein [Lentisphaeria bacterium]
MNAIELSRNLFETYGLPMLKRDFPAELSQIACGIAGRGSDSFGFDDEVSRDHDFEAGFSLWLTDEMEEKSGFRLNRAYRKLAENFPQIKSEKSLYGVSEKGVVRISDFLRRHIGIPRVPESWQEWLYIPDYAFAEVVNGEIFYDESKIFSSIREKIINGMPEDVRYKKLAAAAVLMAQSGQYNYARCLAHGEKAAAILALADFTRYTVSMYFLLNHAFAPYWKWSLRALRTLPCGGKETADDLQMLLCGNLPVKENQLLIEKICAATVEILQENNLTGSSDAYLESHALEITGHIRSGEIRELHLMEGV